MPHACDGERVQLRTSRNADIMGLGARTSSIKGAVWRQPATTYDDWRGLGSRRPESCSITSVGMGPITFLDTQWNVHSRRASQKERCGMSSRTSEL